MNNNIAFNYFWGGFFIFAPLFLKVGSVGMGIRYSHDMLFFVCAIVSLVLFGLENQTKNYLKITIALSLLMVFLNASDFTSFYYLYHLICITAFLILALQFNSFKNTNRKILFNGICISALAQVGFAILNKFDLQIINLIYNPKLAKLVYSSNGSVGSFGNQNILGSFLALSLPFFLRKNWIYFTPLICVGVILSKSTTPIIVMIFVAIGYIFHKKINRTYFLFPIAGLVATVILAKSSMSIKEYPRIGIWRNIAFHSDSFIGRGTAFVANNSRAWKTKNIKRAEQAHNEYLELFANYGIPGFLLISLLIYKQQYLIGQDRVLSSLLMGSFASSFTHFNLHIPITAMIFLIALFYTKKNGELKNV